MSKPSFVYVTYINAPPEKVWNALIDPEMTKDYWGRHRNRSDWKPGSSWQHENYDDPGAVAVAGKVVESEHASRKRSNSGWPRASRRCWKRPTVSIRPVCIRKPS